MKVLFSLILMLSAMVIHANDAIKIINTVFHGINTVTNLARPPTVVVTPGQVVSPAVSYPYVVAQPGETVYLVNGQYMIIRNGVYYPYIRPSPPRGYYGPRRPNYHPPRRHRPPTRPSRASPRKRR